MADYKLIGNIAIGEDVTIGDYAIIGVPAKKFDGDNRTVIGGGSTIRSHTVIYAGNTIGKRLNTGHNTIIREGNSIGDNVSVGSNTTLEIGNRIGNNVKIHSNCIIGEYVIIEDYVWIGPSVITLATLHPPCPKYEECARKDPIVIKKNAKIGGNVTLTPGITIGENSLIGAGAVVTRDIPPNSVVVGNPARVIKTIDELDCKEPYFSRPYEWEDEIRKGTVKK